MSAFNDSRLKTLKNDLDNLLEGQRLMLQDITTLRTRMERETERIRKQYVGDIEQIERRRKSAENRVPDVRRQIENREREITQEEILERKKAA